MSIFGKNYNTIAEAAIQAKINEELKGS